MQVASAPHNSNQGRCMIRAQGSASRPCLPRFVDMALVGTGHVAGSRCCFGSPLPRVGAGGWELGVCVCTYIYI